MKRESLVAVLIVIATCALVFSLVSLTRDVYVPAFCTVFKDGSDTYAVFYNGTELIRDENSSYVCQYAYDSFPERDYKISMSLVGDFIFNNTFILNDGYISLKIDGKITAGNNLNYDVINGTGLNMTYPVRSIEIYGGEIDGNGYNQVQGSPSTCSGVNFNFWYDILVHDIYIHNCYHEGLRLLSGIGAYIHHVISNDNGVGGWGTGIGVSGELDVNPFDVKISHCKTNNNTYDGIDITLVDNVTVSDCIADYNGLGGIAFYACLNSGANLNKAWYNGESGMSLALGQRSDLSHNSIGGNGQEGIWTWFTSYCDISHNYIYNNDINNTGNYNGILVNGTQIIVTNNYVKENHGYEIRVGTGSTECMILDNNLDGYYHIAPLLDEGTDTIIRDNIGVVGVTVDLQHGLILWIPFDNNEYDKSGYGVSTTNTGGTFPYVGKYQYAIYLDTSSYVEFPVYTDFYYTPSTLSFWVNCAYDAYGVNEENLITLFGWSGYNTTTMLCLKDNNAGAYAYGLYGEGYVDGHTFVDETAVIGWATWNNVMIVRNGTHCRTFVNLVDVSGWVAIDDNFYFNRIGYISIGTKSGNVYMDEVRYYNRELSSFERNALYGLGV